MAQPRYVTKTLAAASANNIAQSQTPAGAGALTLNGTTVVGGVAILDSQRQVLLTFAANETGHNFVITGTNENGGVISETIAGTAAGTVASVRSYKTVTSVTISAAATGAIQVGTNTVGDSNWLVLNWHVTPVNIGLAVIASGTINFTVSYTYEDPGRYFPSPSDPPTAFDITALAGKTATTDGGTLTGPIAALRLRINSGTGTATLVYLQAGISQ